MNLSLQLDDFLSGRSEIEFYKIQEHSKVNCTATFFTLQRIGFPRAVD